MIIITTPRYLSTPILVILIPQGSFSANLGTYVIINHKTKILEYFPGVVTRSKTGSLLPRTFNMEALTSRSFMSMVRKGDDKEPESTLLIINKDGEISRMTRSRTIPAQLPQFKLGMEGNFKNYVNQYAINTLALNKPQHNEERVKRQHLSHKFSMTAAGEFKWSGSVYGLRALCVSTLRQTIIHLESCVPSSFLHHNWPLHRENWIKAVNMCTVASDFALALGILEASIKPVLFNHVWHDSLGRFHFLLYVMTNLINTLKPVGKF